MSSNFSRIRVLVMEVGGSSMAFDSVSAVISHFSLTADTRLTWSVISKRIEDGSSLRIDEPVYAPDGSVVRYIPHEYYFDELVE